MSGGSIDAPSGGTKRLSAASQFIGFVPWIAFSFIAQRLAEDGVAWAALIAVGLSVLFIIQSKITDGPQLLNYYSVVIFGAMAVAGFIGDHDLDRWLYEWGRPLVGVVLGLIVLLTSFNLPFTEEYARKTTPQEYWDSPVFRRVNLVLSATWGLAILVMGVCAVLVTAFDENPRGLHTDPHLVDLLLNWVVPIGLIIAMVKFTNSYPDKVRAKYLQNVDLQQPGRAGVPQ